MSNLLLIIMNRVDLNWVLQFRIDGLVKPSRLKEIWALCIMYMYFDFIQCMTIVTRALHIELLHIELCSSKVSWF